MTNDLSDFLLVTLCLFGGIASLLVLLAAIDPVTDRTGLARSLALGQTGRPTGGRPLVGHGTASRYSAGRRSAR